MIDELLLYIVQHLWLFHVLVLAVFLWKTVLFVSYKKNTWHVFNWIYFDQRSIINSRNKDHIRIKKSQNTFSVILLILIFLDLIFVVVSHSIQQ